MKKGLLVIGLILVMALIIPSGCTSPAQAPSPSPTPTPAEFEVSSLVTTPNETVIGQPVTVAVDVKNGGGSESAYLVTLLVNGAKVQTKVVKIPPRG